MRSLFVLLPCLAVCWNCAATLPLPSDFQELVRLLPGYYDNLPQVLEEVQRGVPAERRHQQLSMTIYPAETLLVLPARKNFYVEQWLEGNRSNIIKQRIYSFGMDTATQAIPLKLYMLNSASRFVHVKANDELFSELTDSDLSYSEGCDVFWYKTNGTQKTLFTSRMQETCYAIINGQRVLIMDFNNLTSAYLTAYEQWLLSNGTDVLREPSPYNMTRRPDDDVPRDLSQAGEIILPSVDAVLQALFSGYPLRYRATLSQCDKGAQTGDVTPPQEIVAVVDAFEFFNDTKRFFMEPHVGFSSSSRTVDFTGVFMELTEVRVYLTGLVRIDLSFLSGDLRHVLGTVSYNCTTPTGGHSSGFSVTFMKEDVTLTPLVTYQHLRDALTSGGRVHLVSFYKNCSINATAVGGSVIADVNLYSDRITSSATKTISNYQGPGYVYDIVTTAYWANGSVISTASDRDVVTFKSYYVEQIDCGVIGAGPAKFVSVSDSFL